MHILILEDDLVRHRAFKRSLIGHEVTIVEEADHAIELLKKEDWDVLFLDHDLGGKVYVESGPGTGYEVAEWISTNIDRKPKMVITHSYNEKGRAKILEVLPGAIEAPGAWNVRIFDTGESH